MSIFSAIPYLFPFSDRIYILLFGFVLGIYILGKVLDWVWRYGGMAVIVKSVLYWIWQSSFSLLMRAIYAS